MSDDILKYPRRVRCHDIVILSLEVEKHLAHREAFGYDRAV
jgi:hypothetical protein